MLNCGDDTATEVDHEVMELLRVSYEEAKRLISSHREALDKIAAYLIRKETITGKEFMIIFRAVEHGLEVSDELDKEGLKALDEAVKALTEKKEQAENNTDAKMSGEDGQAEQKGSAESESNEAKAVSETAATVDTAEATASSENPADSADPQNL